MYYYFGYMIKYYMGSFSQIKFYMLFQIKIICSIIII